MTPTVNKFEDHIIIAVAKSEKKIVTISNGYLGCLRVLANAGKYFDKYYPDFYYFDSKLRKSKLPQTELKKEFAHYMHTKMLTNNEIQELSGILKVKLPQHLAERDIKKDKAKKAKHPGKRISATGKRYTENRPNRSDVDRRKRI